MLIIISSIAQLSYPTHNCAALDSEKKACQLILEFFAQDIKKFTWATAARKWF